jgi:DNA-binding CsgD family transcriptional regulator
VAKGVKLTDGERGRILDLVAEGYSYAETARRTGFGVGTVCRTVRAQPDYEPRPVWTEEAIAGPLERLYRSGMGYEAMAARLGISTGHLKRYRRRLGLLSRRWAATAEDVAEMVRLREQGLFYREIAGRLGCSADTVWKQLSGRDDLDLRRARERRGELARQWAYRDYGRYGSTHGR